MTWNGARASGAAAALAALVLGLGSWLAPPASAHSELISADPEDGAVLESAPATVDLTFSEPITPGSAAVSMQDDTGFVVRVLDVQIDGADLLVAWPPGMSGTDYTLNYRVVSDDGHPVDGSVRYTVNSSAAASGPAANAATGATTSAVSGTASGETPASASDAATGGPNAPIIAIAVGIGVGVLVGLIIVMFRRRPGGDGPPPQPEP